MTLETISNGSGIVWKTLHQKGAMTLTQLKKELEESSLGKDDLCAALGWLAREGKLTVSEDKMPKFSVKE